MEREDRWRLPIGGYHGYWSSRWTCRPRPITTFPSLIGGCHGCRHLAWQYGVGGSAKAATFSLPGYSGFLRQAGPGMGSLSPLSLLWGLLLLQGVLRPLRGDPGVYGEGMACMAQAEGIWLLKGQTWGS